MATLSKEQVEKFVKLGKKKKKKSGHFQHIFASQITKMHYSFICLGGESKAIAVDPMKDNDTNLIHFDEFD